MPGWSIGRTFTNWRDSDLPVHEKMAAVIRNNWRKASRLQDCCGNYGEPGC
jgi:hypothetical protein